MSNLRDLHTIANIFENDDKANFLVTSFVNVKAHIITLTPIQDLVLARKLTILFSYNSYGTDEDISSFDHQERILFSIIAVFTVMTLMWISRDIIGRI